MFSKRTQVGGKNECVKGKEIATAWTRPWGLWSAGNHQHNLGSWVQG